MASLLVAGSNALIRRRVLSPFAELRHEVQPLERAVHEREAAARAGSAGGRERRLLLWDKLPAWQQHGSELIHGGYRKACGSFKSCLHSWTYVHNETINIYSHIIGALLFLSLPLYVFTTEIPPRYVVATTTDMVVCSTYLLGVAVCLMLSTAFHTFMSHSEKAYLLGMKLDFQGILLLMWGATVPLIYFGFICHSRLQTVYFGLTTVLAALCSAVTFWPLFSGPHLGHCRAALFGSFGVGSFLAPIVHGMVLDGVEMHSQRIGLPWILATLLFNGLGVTAYSLKFPEKWFPKRFDLFGASHQIMHIMVVFAALAYTVAMLQAFDFRHMSVGCLAGGGGTLGRGSGDSPGAG